MSETEESWLRYAIEHAERELLKFVVDNHGILVTEIDSLGFICQMCAASGLFASTIDHNKNFPCGLLLNGRNS